MMPLWIAIPGFFICACGGYFLCCLCCVSSKSDRFMEMAREIEDLRRKLEELTAEYLKLKRENRKKVI